MSQKKAKQQAVRESYVLSSMGIPAIVTMQNRNTNRNPVAKSLKNKEYKQTIINSKKIYSRKGEKNEIIKELQSSGTDEITNR